jgi:hypothetical protein
MKTQAEFDAWFKSEFNHIKTRDFVRYYDMRAAALITWHTMMEQFPHQQQEKITDQQAEQYTSMLEDYNNE